MKIRNKILLLVIIATILVVFLPRKLVGNKLNSDQSQPSLSPTLTSEEIEEAEQKRIWALYDQINAGDVPECNFGRCPEYLDSTWCPYDEGPCASVVIVPIAMTKGAGQVWVIHTGKVVYKTPSLAEVGAWIVREDDVGNLYVSYISEWKDGVWPITYEVDELIYKDGNYELVKISTENVEQKTRR